MEIGRVRSGEAVNDRGLLLFDDVSSDFVRPRVFWFSAISGLLARAEKRTASRLIISRADGADQWPLAPPTDTLEQGLAAIRGMARSPVRRPWRLGLGTTR